MKEIVKQFVPPVVLKFLGAIKNPKNKKEDTGVQSGVADGQELDVYWTEDMAFQLENWGKAHTWNEIECLLVNCKGKVLDIACGTGVNIVALKRFPNLNMHGFDISDFLIKKAIDKGIDPAKLRVEDGTKTSYGDGEFDYSYSIGSLEHFTEEGIEQFMAECSRYTSMASYHMLPTSESDKNDGWIRTNQSYFNNSVEWWLEKFQKHFKEVQVINSGYTHEGVSVGKWFICFK